MNVLSPGFLHPPKFSEVDAVNIITWWHWRNHRYQYRKKKKKSFCSAYWLPIMFHSLHFFLFLRRRAVPGLEAWTRKDLKPRRERSQWVSVTTYLNATVDCTRCTRFGNPSDLGFSRRKYWRVSVPIIQKAFFFLPYSDFWFQLSHPTYTSYRIHDYFGHAQVHIGYVLDVLCVYDASIFYIGHPDSVSKTW